MKHPEQSTRIVFAIGFSIIAYGLWRVLRPLFPALIWAAVLATVCYPLYVFLAGRLGGRRRLASVLACALIVLLIVIPATFLVTVLARQSVEASLSLQQMLSSPEFDEWLRRGNSQFNDRLSAAFGDTIDVSGMDVRSALLDLLRRISQFLLSAGPALVSGFAGFVVNAFMTVLALYFFFVDGPRLVGELQALVPLPHRHARAVFRQFREVSEATLYGTVLTGLFQGLAGGVIFLSLGLPSPLFWGAMMAIASFIPLFGASLVWVPAAAYLFVTGQLVKGLVLVALGFGLIASIDNLVRLFVVKGRMRLHTLLLFLSILGGLKTFGPLGLILGPLIAALFVTFLSIYKAEFRSKAE